MNLDIEYELGEYKFEWDSEKAEGIKNNKTDYLFQRILADNR